MMSRPIRFLAFWTCIFGVLAFLGSIRARQVRAEQSRTYGRFNARQVIERTEPLCRALAANDSGFTLSAWKYGLEDFGPRPFWEVECADGANRYLAHFLWDAQAGELFRATRALAPPVGGERALDRRILRKTASRWLLVLGLAAESPGWRPSGVPYR